MKIIIAPDSFKGSLTAEEVAAALYHGFQIHFPQAEYIIIPMADGGEGTLDCLMKSNKGQYYKADVQDPLGNSHSARFGVLKDPDSTVTSNIAVIETAEASGLPLIPSEKRNPLLANTAGSGELILEALNQGCREFIVGLGGSGTSDGGMGALSALGIQFKNALGENLKPNGDAMSQLHSIDISLLDPRLAESHFTLAYDVDNPLLGLQGALMYAPQKGATPSQIEILHKGYEQLAHVIFETTGKNVGNIPGGGAAGGLGAGLYAFLNAELVPGSQVIIEHARLKEKMKDASLILTGEGQIDNQSIHGKAPIAVAKLAKSFQIPVIAVTGNLKEGYEEVYHHGIDAVFSIAMGPMSLEESIKHSKSLIINTAFNIAKCLNLRLI